MRKNNKSNEKGFALILTLGILSLLMVMGMAFAFSARTQKKLAQTSSDSIKAKLIANSAINTALAMLRDNGIDADSNEQVTYLSQMFDKADPSSTQNIGGLDVSVALKSYSSTKADGTILGVDSNLQADKLAMNASPYLNDILTESTAITSTDTTTVHSVFSTTGKGLTASEFVKNLEDLQKTGFYTMYDNEGNIIGRFNAFIINDSGKINLNEAQTVSSVPVVDNTHAMATTKKVSSDSGEQEFYYNIYGDYSVSSSSSEPSTTRMGTSLHELNIEDDSDGSQWLSYAQMEKKLGDDVDVEKYTFVSPLVPESYWDKDDEVERQRFDITGFEWRMRKNADGNDVDVYYKSNNMPSGNYNWNSASNDYADQQSHARRLAKTLASCPARPEFWNDEHEEGTCNPEDAADAPSPFSPYYVHTVEYQEVEKEIVGYNKKTDGYEKKVTGYEQKITGYKQKITGYEQKIVGYEQKVTGYEQKLVGYEQKLVGYEQKIVGYQQKKDGYYKKTVRYSTKIGGMLNGGTYLRKETEIEKYTNLWGKEKTREVDYYVFEEEDRDNPKYVDDLTKPIKENDLTKPIYENDTTKPIYEDDLEKPIYGNDLEKPIYANDTTKPIYGDDLENPIYADDTTKPIYGDDLDKPIMVDDYDNPIYQFKYTTKQKQILDNSEDDGYNLNDELGIPYLEGQYQIAANMVDYCDDDDYATLIFPAGKANEISYPTTSGEENMPEFVGNENVSYINEFAFKTKIRCKVMMRKEENLPTIYKYKYSLTYSMENLVELVNVYLSNKNIPACECEIYIFGNADCSVDTDDILTSDEKLIENDTVGKSDYCLNKDKEWNDYDNPIKFTCKFDASNGLGYSTENFDTSLGALSGRTRHYLIKSNLEFPTISCDININRVLIVTHKENNPKQVYDIAEWHGSESRSVLYTADSSWINLPAEPGSAYDTVTELFTSATIQAADPRYNYSYGSTDPGNGAAPTANSCPMVMKYNSAKNCYFWYSIDSSNPNYESQAHTIGKDNTNLIGKYISANGTNMDKESGISFESGSKKTFSSAFIRNAPFEGLWELGLIHRGTPGQTINLKKFSDEMVMGNYQDGDAALLDQVKIGPARFSHGKISAKKINKKATKDILEGVGFSGLTNGTLKTPSNSKDFYDQFDGTTEVDTAKLTSSPASDDSIRNRGILADNITQLVETQNDDLHQEAFIGRTANLTEARYKTMTVVVTAQAMKEMKGMTGKQFSSVKKIMLNPTAYATVNQKKTSGKINATGRTIHFCSVLSTQVVFATILHDTWTNSFEVIQIETIH